MVTSRGEGNGYTRNFEICPRVDLLGSAEGPSEDCSYKFKVKKVSQLEVLIVTGTEVNGWAGWG